VHSVPVSKSPVTSSLAISCQSSGGQSLSSHSGEQRSSPGQYLGDLWWTKRQWDRFFSVSIIPSSLIHQYSTWGTDKGCVRATISQIRSHYINNNNCASLHNTNNQWRSKRRKELVNIVQGKTCFFGAVSTSYTGKF
jgi:hypothetical protein